MPITKRTVLDQIIVDPVTGSVSWREAVYIEEDGVEISKQYHRGSVDIDSAVPSNMPAQVMPFRDMVDTPETRKAAKDRADKNQRRN